MTRSPHNLFVGPAGWSYPDWNNLIYPSRRSKNFSELALISRMFNVVEIGSTYYHPQSASASAQWLAQVEQNPRFRFTARIWQKFVLERTFDGGIGYSQSDIELAKRGLWPLLEAGRLGGLLVQFPQSFHYKHENRNRLFRLLDAFQEYPLVVEIRHNSWNRAEVLNQLNQRGVGFANIDQPQIGQALDFTEVVCGRIAYFRFYGRNRQQWLNKDAGVDERYNYLYSGSELNNFVAPIQNALRQTECTYVIFNNHPRGHAVVNALQLQFELTGTKAPLPDTMLKAFPDLVRLKQGPNPQQVDLF